MPNPRFLWSFIFCLFAAYGSAQTIYVFDIESHEPVRYAEAINQRSQQISIANATGKIQLIDYKKGDVLFISAQGYNGITAQPKEGKNSFFLPRSINIMSTALITTRPGDTVRLDDLPNRIDVIDVAQIRFKNPQTAADVLTSDGNVFVQKSQMGGGSPVLRGFEANKVLLVVDGVRMNNAIYRSGHLQNAITIDPQILQRAEVIFGPSSVTYGSDALGGVVHYHTRDPLLGEQMDGEMAGGHLSARISSANQERTFHADVSVGYDRLGFLTSISRSEFGNLRMGSNRMHGDDEWGLVNVYPGFSEGSDIVIENADPDIQYYTAYDQIDFLQKIAIRASETVRWTGNFQYSTSSDVPRFDRYNDLSDGEPRWAEWDYGPQQRLFASLQTSITDTTAFYNSATLTAAFQRLDESRIQRRFGRSTRTTQDEDVWVYSFNADFERSLHRKVGFNYGLEVAHNVVESRAWSQELGSRTISDAATRYPDDGATMTTYAAYFGLSRKLGEEVDLKFGARYTYGQLAASFADNAFYDLPFNSIDFNRGALTGSLGLIYRPDSTWKIAAVAGSGFRIPNVDDFGKVREKDGFALVPTDDLKPEYAYNAELTIEKKLLENRLQIAATGFYTVLRNAIVQRNSELNGQDSIVVEGTLAEIQTNQNTNNAFIYGYFFGVTAAVADHWSVKARYNFTYGQDTGDDIPLGHIPPVFASASINFQGDNFRGELSSMFNAKKSIDRYAPGSTDNPAETLPDGNPSWWTLSLRTSYFLTQTLEAQVALENILDVHYKTFASGLSAPGRNLVVGLRAAF